MLIKPIIEEGGAIKATKNSIAEMERRIEIEKAFLNGEKIEYTQLNSNNCPWTETANPYWFWEACDYRIKHVQTNLEKANEIMKKVFGIEECFDSCGCPLCMSPRYCDDNCTECRAWWYEPYEPIEEE